MSKRGINKAFLMVLCIAVLVSIMTSTIPNTALADTGEIKVIVNGNPVYSDVPAVIENGRTLVPMRTILNAMNASVTWYGNTNTVLVEKGDTRITVVIGSKTSVVNDKEISLDVPAKIIDGRTMLPLRFVTQALGASVNWNGDTRTITITTSEQNSVTLNFWHHWGETDSLRPILDESISKIQNAHPNIRINSTALEPDTYDEKLNLALAANDAPDIFYYIGGEHAQPLIDSGKVLELTDYLPKETMDKLVAGSLDFYTNNYKIYGLPSVGWITALFCNYEMFSVNGIKEPETFDELLDAVKKFRKKGIVPMQVGEKDLWPGAFYYNLLAMRECGKQECLNAVLNNSSFDQPGFTEAARKLQELVKAGAFDSSCTTLYYSQSVNMVKEGQSPMIFTGSWICNDFESSLSSVSGKIKPLIWPLSPDGAGDGQEFLAGFVEGLYANSDTRHKEEAILALKELSYNIGIEGFKNGKCISPWKLPKNVQSSSSLLTQLQMQAESAKCLLYPLDGMYNSKKAEIYKNLVQALFEGVVTPEEFSEQLQKELNEE